MFNEMGRIALIYLYVDDLIITANVYELIKEIKVQTSQVFEMKALESYTIVWVLKSGEILAKLFCLKESMSGAY